MDLGDTNLLREITHFRFAIAGQDHGPSELVFRSEMSNEGTSLGPGRVAKPKRGCEFPIDDDDAFESTTDRWKMLRAWNLFRNKFAAARNLNLMTTDHASQSLTRRFGDPGRLLKLKPWRCCCGENGASKRMFRIQLKARGQCEHFFLCETGRKKLIG